MNKIKYIKDTSSYPLGQDIVVVMREDISDDGDRFILGKEEARFLIMKLKASLYAASLKELYAASLKEHREKKED